MSALRKKFAIVGMGLVAGRYSDRSRRMLQSEAARLAIEDAGLSVSQVDGAIDMRIFPGSGDMPSETDAFPRVIGMPCRMFFTIGRGGATVVPAVVAATKFLELGICNYVVLSSGTSDWTRSRVARKKGITSLNMIDKAGYWGKPFGDLAAVSHHSSFASRHIHEYGTKPEHFGEAAIAARTWAALNPLAQFHGKPLLTMEEYLSAPPMVEPYRKYDMCVVSDGGMAFVMTTAERAADLKRKPVQILGAGCGEAMERLWWEKGNYTSLAVDTAKEAAFREAEVGIDDIDVAGLYDCFTGEVLFQLEDYGWCRKGEAGDFISGGRIARGGALAINTGGGLLASYHLGELTHVAEVITQLRGEAGERQIKNAEVGLISGHGGEILSPGMCSTHGTLILGRG
jgi:acetyl-CoA acetyltransferase